MLETFFVENSRVIIPVVLFVALLWCFAGEVCIWGGGKSRMVGGILFRHALDPIRPHVIRISAVADSYSLPIDCRHEVGAGVQIAGRNRK